MENTVDKSTLGGILIAICGIGFGLWLDGGKFVQILQPTAALIVIGGTMGAVLVQFPLPIVRQAIVQLKDVFFDPKAEPDAVVQHLLRFAYKARKDGLLSLEPELAKISDPFLKESVMVAIDGVKAADLRKMMELQLEYRGEKDERIPKVFEAAAGFCAYDRHHWSGSRPHSSHAALARYQPGWQRDCRCFRGDDLRGWLGEPVFPALGGQAQNPHS